MKLAQGDGAAKLVAKQLLQLIMAQINDLQMVEAAKSSIFDFVDVAAGEHNLFEAGTAQEHGMGQGRQIVFIEIQIRDVHRH